MGEDIHFAIIRFFIKSTGRNSDILLVITKLLISNIRNKIYYNIFKQNKSYNHCLIFKTYAEINYLFIFQILSYDINITKNIMYFTCDYVQELHSDDLKLNYLTIVTE